MNALSAFRDHLRLACLKAMIETAIYHPADDLWQLVQRTVVGRIEIECVTSELADTLQRLASGLNDLPTTQERR